MHPVLLQQVVFWGQDGQTRFQSAKDELAYLFRLIFAESFEIAYFTCFLPIKFIKSTLNGHNDEVYVD